VKKKNESGRKPRGGVKQDQHVDDERRRSDSKSRTAKLSTARRRWASLLDDLVRVTTHLGGSAGQYRPRCDIQKTPERMLVCVDLPGVSKESITVNVENWALTVRGRRGARETGNGQTAGEHPVELRECERGPFERTIPLERNADASRIEAAYQNGVLTVLVHHRGPDTIQVPIGDDADALRQRWEQLQPLARAVVATRAQATVAAHQAG
jgi:HSP20 family molecular chaperone IbpA